MKTTLCIFGLILAASLATSQSAKDAAKPDLSKLSSDQLKACQGSLKACGTDDFLSINDELAKRLGEYTTGQILACYDDWKICGVEESGPTGWPISDYLASRGDPHDLLVRYWKERKFMIRNGIERVAYHFDTPEVTAFMRRVLIERRDDGEDFYWPANYLAKKCDPLGLKELSTGRHRNQGSLQYQTTLPLFGKCQYRPAIPYLAGIALYDFSYNIVGAAEESLEALYPDHPKNFETLEDEQNYYCGRAKKEGFKLHCATK
jgi:hypothetical protein